MIEFNKDKILDFKYSKTVIKHYAKSFYLSSQFLPKKKRLGSYAVYCFCRYTDNIVDNPRNRTNSEILIELDHLKLELENSYKYGESEHPALSTFAIVAKEYNIPKKYAFELIEGVQMDMTKNRYKSFDDLYLFCYRVAATVGLMMTYVLGFKNDNTLVYAEKLGIAMQLTNILRDIEEDVENDRIYLPQQELEKYGVSESDIKNHQFNSNIADLMKFNVDRARQYYKDAEDGIAELDKNSRFAIYAASRIYSGILNKIMERNFNPFLGRVFVPKSKKLKIVFSELVKTKL
ncbi:phytoene/squalene synthase family protein [Candidatus Kapabacteria bacterium]|nr:phytoene/squalene synthase family protein [Candidatus Kapabacteria bacterium]